ncbi:MAG: RsmE family RNA methyltransferase [Gemmatimonadota bacterium]|nr:RsmE family RNA methyltransferase [Gemmatimonadota bacterium]MXW04280.1 16S rRNA (uracil(1498)-N(3))-methyltransferase [Gemmatimonadota bacterium]MYB62132.1 16S rRNA (uracil(1498)-N(3))-methyltransferase [Gemmatimonadota bacterium]
MEFSYVPPERITGNSAFVTDKDEQHHLARSLRKKPGDAVHFVDGEGWIYDGVLVSLKPEIEIQIRDRRRDRETESPEVTLAPSLLKGTRLDTVVEKATELGVSAILPMRTARTVAGGRPAGRQAGQRLDRWRRIALSAMKQSLRARLPRIEPVTSIGDVVGTASSYDLALIAWEEEGERRPGLAAGLDATARRVLLMIGPEGGFAGEEIAMAREAGMVTVSLGRSRLRSDTAAIAGLALLMAALDAP